MLVITAQQMKQVEQNSLTYDLTYARLMENAGSAAAAFIRQALVPIGKTCVLFCGKGNNGGDGFVVARKLHEIGSHVIVVLVDTPPTGGEAAAMYSMLDVLNIPVISAGNQYDKIRNLVEHADIIVDAIFGTGFLSKLPEGIQPYCEIINHAIAAVVSLDIPSGVECDSGYIAANAIKADFTIVFDALKPLHIFDHSSAMCGQIECVPIGIPLDAYSGIETMLLSIFQDLVWKALPQREPSSHKGTHGKLLSLCGSRQYRGAAVLSTMGALRSGVGLCLVAAIEVVCNTVVNHLPEATLVTLPENSNGIDLNGTRSLLAPHLSNSQAILFGSGSGDTPSTRSLLEYLLTVSTAPIVLDADALTILANHLDLLDNANAPVIITPHPGEMAKLCHVSIPEIQKNRLYIARQFALKHKVHIVLKGHETIVATPEGKLFVNTTGNPGLAKGGSGDVLAGMLGSLLAQGIPTTDAAISAVWLHGAAADLCAKRKSQYSMLPSDILEDLGEIFLQHGR